MKTTRIAFCGSHGSGKSTLASPLSKKLGLPLILSPASTYWDLIDEPDISKIETEWRKYDEYVILGLMAQQIASNPNAIFERTPLDVLMHCIQQKISDVWWYERSLKIIEHLDTIIYVPYEADLVGDTRQEQERYKESVGIAVECDKILQDILDFRHLPNITNFPKVIHVSGSVENRLRLIDIGLSAD